MAISKRLRFEIFRRDNHTCRYCGGRPPAVVLRIDHVIPEALGGSDEPNNLVTSCDDCNSGKSSASPDATHVAAVSESAARWSSAIAAAAAELLDDMRLEAKVHDWFKEEWVSWKRDQWDKGSPLPPDWASEITRFRSLGVPEELILGAVETTMARGGVDDRWRYFCGVVWNIVRRLQERAQDILNGTERPVGNDPAEVLCRILDACDPPLSPWEYDRIVGEFRGSQ